MILGGCGVTLEEMTSLFSAIANNGVYAPANFLQHQKRGVQDTILSASSSFMLTEILSQIARPDLPTNWEGSTKLPRIAWKTGTSYGRRDAWSIGFNKRFTIGVWVGNFSGAGVPELNGAAVATPLLFQLFNTIDYNSPNEWYAMPRDCGIRSVCSETGLTPNHFCESIVNDYFIPLISSNKICQHKKDVAVDAKEQFSYCTHCLPENGYQRKWYTSPTPELQFWFEENNIPYNKVPPHNPDCERISEAGAPKIVSPVNNNEYLLEKQNPEPLQLSCQTDAEVSHVFWFINNKLLRKAKANEKIFFTPAEGTVKISCTDDKARNTDVWIKVRYVKL
jgi:penicillin-binding protein 1C